MRIDQNDVSLTLWSDQGDYIGIILVSPGQGYKIDLHGTLSAQELRQLTHIIVNFVNRIVILPSRE